MIVSKHEKIHIYNLLVKLTKGLSGGWGNDPDHHRTNWEVEDMQKQILLDLLAEGVIVKTTDEGTLYIAL